MSICTKYQHVWSLQSRVIFGYVRYAHGTSRAYNMEQRIAIKFCVRLQKSFVETYSMIQQIFGDDIAFRSTTYKW